MLVRADNRVPVLDIKIRNAVMQLRINPHDLKLSIDQGKFKVKVTLPDIMLDATKAWEDLGQKKIGKLVKDMAQEAKIEGLQNIKKVSGEGDELARDIRPECERLIEMIKAKQFRHVDYNVDAIPKHMAEVAVIKGGVDVVYVPYDIDVRVPGNVVDIHYSPGRAYFELKYVDILG
jgi:hypothetical protein